VHRFCPFWSSFERVFPFVIISLVVFVYPSTRNFNFYYAVMAPWERDSGSRGRSRLSAEGGARGWDSHRHRHWQPEGNPAWITNAPPGRWGRSPTTVNYDTASCIAHSDPPSRLTNDRFGSRVLVFRRSKGISLHPYQHQHEILSCLRCYI
jgi:hypothetical protein